MLSFYRIYYKYKSSDVVHDDMLTTATSLNNAAEYGKMRLAGSKYDDGSLPAFVKAKRISRAEAKKMYDELNPIDWIQHDEMRVYLED